MYNISVNTGGHHASKPSFGSQRELASSIAHSKGPQVVPQSTPNLHTISLAQSGPISYPSHYLPPPTHPQPMQPQPFQAPTYMPMRTVGQLQQSQPQLNAASGNDDATLQDGTFCTLLRIWLIILAIGHGLVALALFILEIWYIAATNSFGLEYVFWFPSLAIVFGTVPFLITACLNVRVCLFTNT